MQRLSIITLVLVSLILVSCGEAAGTTPTAVAAIATGAVSTTVPTSMPASATATRVIPTATKAPVVTLSRTTPPDTRAAPSPTLTRSPAPSATRPSPTVEPSPRPPTATPTDALPTVPDPAVGRAIWPDMACSSCHGANAQGDIGPRLAGTGLSFDQILAAVRLGKGAMPAFGEDQVAEAALRHIYAWLRSLARPAPTAIAPPSYPTGALTEMWYYVNEMRIRADFAKDLPVRQASDEAGRLAIVRAYAGDGLAQADTVLARANQALGEVPVEGVRAIISRVIDQTTSVAALFRQAQAETTYQGAWQQVAQAVLICRLDTLPWATQAVRDAGLTGTVRILVVDQTGRPIEGALATVLTAHTPLGTLTDAAGRATFRNVAAVPALPVKAYVGGRVYHEINANVAAGATVDGTIALPPLPAAGVAPSVSGASIVPASGPGNATLTFSVTATDPQGRGDLAEDQIFALNPVLGLAYVMRYNGGDRYQVQERPGNLAVGTSTWYFFAVDHECNTSSVIPVNYQVTP